MRYIHDAAVDVAQLFEAEETGSVSAIVEDITLTTGSAKAARTLLLREQ